MSQMALGQYHLIGKNKKKKSLWYPRHHLPKVVEENYVNDEVAVWSVQIASRKMIAANVLIVCKFYIAYFIFHAACNYYILYISFSVLHASVSISFMQRQAKVWWAQHAQAGMHVSNIFSS